MKKVFLFLVTILTTFTLSAQKVALHSTSGVQHFNGITGFVNAYNAAVSGDTIYLPGGGFTPPANIDKSLTVFGAGHYPDSTMATSKTFINGNIALSENADLFYLEGVEITGNLTFAANKSVDNVVVKRCKINGTFTATGNLTQPSSNMSLIGNVIGGRINLENIQTSLLSNNIIANTFHSSDGNLITNNIVLGYIYGYSMDYLFIGNNNTVNNNIFIWEGYNANVSGTGNTFNNNLYVEATPNYGAAAVATGNYTDIPQAEIFVYQSGVAFNYAHDYHLQNPSTYIGTDGSEVGIYGGGFPYKEGAVPSNPHFQISNLAPQTDGDGNLNIQIQVEAQDN